jgi:hypothetical protein
MSARQASLMNLTIAMSAFAGAPVPSINVAPE